jgi:DNA-binding response OmpR family regulator
VKTILVVDDEFDLTSTLKAVFETRGYRTEVCSNGREALDCLRDARPDLVLLDVMIPLGSGFAVLDRLRSTAEFAETPVVLMNVVPPPGDRPVRWQAFVKKPLALGTLLETVERLIGPGESGGDPAPDARTP